MGFITGFVDVQDSSGASIIPGLRPPLVLQVGSGLTAAYSKSGDQGFVALSATTPSVAPPTAIARTTYTDSSPHTVATIAVPAGGIVVVDLQIAANLGIGNLNAPNQAGYWRCTVLLARGLSSNVIEDIKVAGPAGVAPFLPLQNASTPGCVALVAGSTSATLTVNGFSVKEAWTIGHTYNTGDGSSQTGDFVTANGSVWLCTTSGTASGSAPSGTGQGVGTGAKFDYVCAGSTVPVQFWGQYSTL